MLLDSFGSSFLEPYLLLDIFWQIRKGSQIFCNYIVLDIFSNSFLGLNLFGKLEKAIKSVGGAMGCK